MLVLLLLRPPTGLMARSERATVMLALASPATRTTHLVQAVHATTAQADCPSDLWRAVSWPGKLGHMGQIYCH